MTLSQYCELENCSFGAARVAQCNGMRQTCPASKGSFASRVMFPTWRGCKPHAPVLPTWEHLGSNPHDFIDQQLMGKRFEIMDDQIQQALGLATERNGIGSIDFRTFVETIVDVRLLNLRPSSFPVIQSHHEGIEKLWPTSRNLWENGQFLGCTKCDSRSRAPTNLIEVREVVIHVIRGRHHAYGRNGTIWRNI